MSDPAADDGDTRASKAIPDTTDVSAITSAREAAALFGLHERTIRRAIARGDLPAIKEGRAFRITPEALDRFRAQRLGGDAGRSPSSDRHGALPVPFPGETRSPAELPSPPLTRFVGRASEIDSLARLLRGPARLVTLVGPGGIGKTRLALESARSILADFAAGSAFVSLTPIRSAELVVPTIARRLGVRVGAAQSAFERVAAYLRDREILLVLDNVEQVTDAAPVLSDLLAACPRLKILVTSRAPLRTAGEHLFAVPPLALPRDQPAGDTRPRPLDALATVEAVALFVDRARAASPGFAMTAANAAVIAAICERTDGVPLAIELAAARTSVLSLTDLRDRMSHQLAILRGGPRDQPPRLRSMADAIGWSYNLLSSDERSLLRRLSIFVGGVALDAAETVGGRRSGVGGTAERPSSDLRPPTSDSVLDLLTALVDQSLLQRVTGPGGATRYAMLETVREYGLERLAESGEEAAVRDAHADWCVVLAEQADPALSGPDQATWFDRLEAEHPNMRAALTWLLKGQDAARGLRLTTALSWFWSSRGYLREALGWLEDFLTLPVVAPPLARAMGLREASNIAQWQGEFDRAAELATESQAVFHEHGDQRRVAYGLRGLGSIDIDRERLDEAAAFLSESWEMLRPLATAWDAAFAIYLWGRLASARGRHADAAEHFSEAATAFRQVGDRAYVAGSLGRLGAASLRIKVHGTARTAYAESLRLAQELNDQSWIAWALIGAAYLAASEGRPESAARLLGAALAIRKSTGERGYPDDVAPSIDAAVMSERYTRARAQGAALTRERIIAEALAILEVGAAKRRAPRAATAGSEALTGRERNVLRLLVDGLSDKEIAATLGISRYTASNHVASILAKLGVPSRTAAVALDVRDDLV
jgi:non-specific serine/threonine protein kinase